MAYSRNFGFRSFENIVRDGRSRTPAGTAYQIGEPVTLDPATPGFLKQAAAAEGADGASGVLVYEYIIPAGVDPVLADISAAPFNTVPGGAYAQMVHGAGVKVWFKNTAAKTLYDGRVRAAAALLAASVNLATLAPGDGLTPDGAGKFKKANGTTDPNWFVVEQTNATTGLVEARFNF